MSRISRRKAIVRRRIFICVCIAVLIAITAGICLLVSAIKSAGNGKKDKEPSASGKETSSYESSESETGEPTLVSSATVINTGDIMVHSTQLDGAKRANGEYDFTDFFKNIGEYISKADLGVANLEVTFGGTESGSYKGYPAFNTPDCLADVIKDAGFDLLLTTNNHAYDTGLFGLKRTTQILDQKGFSYVGTRADTGKKTYTVQDINGIKLGMTAYSYENKCDTPGRKSLNGNIISADANDLINTFNYDRITEFYEAAQDVIKQMKNDGAEKIIFYMHWGEEYQLKENVWQNQIAQKLCNMGVDIIVGSHPHVIQPVSLINSEDGEHKTVCVYSMGNAISNQRQELMNPECTTGHTEDGMLFSYKFDKYSDGSVVLSGVEIIPTWVNKYSGGSGYLYTVVPLKNKDDGANYGLSGTPLSKSQSSYERTKAIVSEGLGAVQDDIGCKRSFE